MQRTASVYWGEGAHILYNIRSKTRGSRNGTGEALTRQQEDKVYLVIKMQSLP